MNNTAKYIVSALIIASGILLALFSRVLFPPELNGFWRALLEVLGYGTVAVGCCMAGIIGKKK